MSESLRLNIQVRLANIDEVTSISSLLHQAFIEYKPLYTPEAFTVTTPAAHEIANRWEEGPVWVALQNNIIVGTIAVVAETNSLYVRSMAVAPLCRGYGIGRLLLEEVQSYARHKDFEQMQLFTTPFLHDAIQLYERFGFKMTGVTKNLAGTPLLEMQITF